ncbi:MAG: hypothetical protein GX241_05675 [Ruminococcaceae bacterium]|nr:hypothetical protein [Oscillospiraceae bacterium]
MTETLSNYEEMSKKFSKHLLNTFSVSFLLDLTENKCAVLFNREGQPVWEVLYTVDEALEIIADTVIHPLFKQRFLDETSKENLMAAAKENRGISFEALCLDKKDNEYHWFVLRLTPCGNYPDEILFTYNALNSDLKVKNREKKRTELFNQTVLNQLISDFILVYVIDLSNEMSRLVLSEPGEEYDIYARRFKDHKEMMTHLYENFIIDDFKRDFFKLMDYDYLKKHFDSGKDRIVYIFRDNRAITFELNIIKYADYAEDYPLIIFGIKKLS